MDDAQAQYEKLTQEIEQELADGNLGFPTFFEVSLKIQRTLEREDAGLDTLVPLIALEPLLATRVIGLANSVLFGSDGTVIRDIKSAVMRVGVAAVRSLALAVATSQLAQSDRLGPVRRIAVALWDHSVDVAAWSYALARYVRTVNADEAMLAGMTHDIGQFYLLGKAADYPALLDAETELSDLILGWHKQVGRSVLQALGAPEELLEVVDDREIYGGSWPPESLSEVLFVANLAAESRNPLTLMSEAVRDNLLKAVTHGVDAAAFETLKFDAADERSRALSALRS